MTRSRRIPCPRCSKLFRTDSGLRWHLYHRHDWQNVHNLLEAPSSVDLARAALHKELGLMVFAKELGMDIGYLERLIDKHFGKHEN